MFTFHKTRSAIDESNMINEHIADRVNRSTVTRMHGH